MNEGLVVRMVSAFYRDNEPGGIATGMQFHGDDGVEFCKLLVEALPRIDAETTVDIACRALTYLSPRRHQLKPVEVADVISVVNWLQVRGHLVADEYNGTIFVCEFEGALVSCETNPVTIDLAKERTGEDAVDVTDILRAARGTLDGGKSAVRAAADHTRGR